MSWTALLSMTSIMILSSSHPRPSKKTSVKSLPFLQALKNPRLPCEHHPLPVLCLWQGFTTSVRLVKSKSKNTQGSLYYQPEPCTRNKGNPSYCLIPPKMGNFSWPLTQLCSPVLAESLDLRNHLWNPWPRSLLHRGFHPLISWVSPCPPSLHPLCLPLRDLDSLELLLLFSLVHLGLPSSLLWSSLVALPLLLHPSWFLQPLTSPNQNLPRSKETTRLQNWNKMKQSHKRLRPEASSA